MDKYRLTFKKLTSDHRHLGSIFRGYSVENNEFVLHIDVSMHEQKDKIVNYFNNYFLEEDIVGRVVIV